MAGDWRLVAGEASLTIQVKKREAPEELGIKAVRPAGDWLQASSITSWHGGKGRLPWS
jgi:hypothetical protein